jgi:putative PIN family toxin of toxin-antitoxin system
MKITLDTNILIAAYISHGACAELLEHCIRQHTLFTSEYILKEFKQNLIKKFKFKAFEADEAEKLLRSRMTLVNPSNPDCPLLEDPTDLPILGTALSGHCQCLITGDHELLALQQFEWIKILSPSLFWKFESLIK